MTVQGLLGAGVTPRRPSVHERSDSARSRTPTQAGTAAGDAVQVAVGHEASVAGPDKLLRDYIGFIALLRSAGKGPDAYATEVRRLEDSARSPLESDPAGTDGPGSLNAAESRGGGSVGAVSFRATEVSVAIEMSASVSADIRSADGTSVHIEAEARVAVEARISMLEIAAPAAAPQVQQKDPLVLDLNGDGQISLTGSAGGPLFDLDGDGVLDRASVATHGDVMLALDRDGNGRIDDGSELFGDHHGAKNGFVELGRFDADGNGRIDPADSVYAQLVGATYDGAGRMVVRSLAELGVAAIELSYADGPDRRIDGGTVAEEGTFTRSDGSIGYAADVLLDFQRAIDTRVGTALKSTA